MSTKGGVFAIGNFDGIHKGHQAIIKTVVAMAKELSVPAKILSFTPNTKQYFNPKIEPFKLINDIQKDKIVKELGIDEIILLPFTKEIVSMTWKDFVKQVLIERFSISHLVSGSDFAFGKNREGNLKVISEVFELTSIKITEISRENNNGEIYSSTRARKLLLEGYPEKAADILGRNWAIQGHIIHGNGIGNSELETRTANMLLNDYIRPKLGVYVIKAHRLSEPKEQYYGIANIGKRPTISGHDVIFEAHLFDFNQEIYSENWEFEILHFLRPEAKFANISELKKQIHLDIMNTRKWLLHSK